MTLQQLEYIVALDTYRHYVTAADNCFVTQPTITIQVKKLENEIGVQIFDRNKTPLEPTPVGEIIIIKARSILQEVKQLKELVNTEVVSLEGSFRLAVIPTISPYIIPRFTGSFAKNYPQTHLHIEEMQTEVIIKALEKNQIDLAILVTPLQESFIREIPLYNEPFVYYANTDDDLLQKPHVTQEELVGKDGLWLLSNGHCFRNQVLNICHSEPDKRSIHFQSGSIETLKKMVDNYGGYTLIPELSFEKEDIPQVREFTAPKPIREVSLVVNKGFAKEGLIDALRKEILKTIPPSFEKNERFIKVMWR